VTAPDAPEPTAHDTWVAVDDYLAGLLLGSDAALDAALDASAAAGLPPIQVSPTQGRFLHLLVRIAGARRVLEVGTLGGYSTIWLARALPPGGRLVTLELDERHAAVARANLDRAGVDDRVEVRVGPALETLPALEREGGEPFDLVFVDADKPSNADYLAWAVRLGRPGTVVVVDNVVRGGAVVDADDERPDVVGTRRLFDELAARSDVVATAIQTVGVKGYDGFVLAVVGGA
jgi:predicted O-methyltransferase YrrM